MQVEASSDKTSIVHHFITTKVEHSDVQVDKMRLTRFTMHRDIFLQVRKVQPKGSKVHLALREPLVDDT